MDKEENKNLIRIVSCAVMVCIIVLLCGASYCFPVHAEGTSTEATTQTTTEATTQTKPPLTTEATTEAPKPKVSLEKPKLKSVKAYETGKIVVKWNAVPDADYYLVFRKYKNKSYKQIAQTRKLKYTDKWPKAYKQCYYKVQAVKEETPTTALSKSKKSSALHKKSRRKAKKIAYVGDSVMSGFEVYGALDPEEESFAKVSLFVQEIENTFLGSVNAYKPDRVYIMCGTNNCVGNQSLDYLKGVVADYEEVCKSIHKNNSRCEIVVMGIGNTRTPRVPNSTVNTYNKLLKKMAKKHSYTHYFDTGSYLNDYSGSLAATYSAGDGIHWSSEAYNLIHSKLKKFVRYY
ncbi:MAG: hypothetical protein IKH94_04125 [Eubacterium sp.]|nr:hypothetical protein [Eubacterium sp.]